MATTCRNLASQLILVLFLACGASSLAQAQSCKIPPGNPACASDSTSQSNPNGSTGAGNPIDITSGNKYQQETDIDMAGELSIGFRRHYNSVESRAGVLGRGWSHTYETQLSRTERRASEHAPQPVPSITVTQGDGRQIAFEPYEVTAAVRRYRSAPRGYGVIEENLEALSRLRSAVAAHRTLSMEQSVWTWSWANGRTLSFNGRGLLNAIEGVDGKVLRPQFDAQRRLARVTDGFGNFMTASYWDDPAERLRAFTSTSSMQAHRGAGYRGRLKALTLSNGERIEYEYDSHGNLADVVYADGTIRRYDYAQVGGRDLLSNIYGRDGRLFASYEYASDGRATRSAHPDHRDDVKLSYQLPTQKRPFGETVVEDAGLKTTYTWRADPKSLLPEILKAEGPGCRTCAASNVRYEYDADGRVSKSIRVDGDGKPIEQIASSSDSLGRLVSREISPVVDGKLQLAIWRESFAYEGDRLRPSVISRPSVVPGHERTLHVEYNTRGQPTRIIEDGYQFEDSPGLTQASLLPRAMPLHRVTALTYANVNGMSLLHSIDGPLAGKADSWTYAYDKDGRLIAVTHPTRVVEHFERDTWGRISSHVGLDGVRESFEYGPSGHLSRFARGDVWMSLRYDTAGRLDEVLDSLGQQLTLTRDEAGEVTQLADPAGNRIHWDYDGHGEIRDLRLLSPNGEVSQRARRQSIEMLQPVRGESMPNEDMLSAVAGALPDEAAAAIPEKIGSDSVAAPGRLLPTGMRYEYDSQQRATTYQYDDFGRMTSQHSPVTGTMRFRWDEADHLIERIAADDSTTRITRDALGRAVRVRAGPEDGSIEWGVANRPTRVTFRAGEERFEYDSQARLTSHRLLIDSKTFSIEYGFDSLGRLSSKKLPDGSVLHYHYNGPLSAKPGLLNAIYRGGIVERPILTDLNAPGELYDNQGFVFGNGLSQRRLLDVHGSVVSDGNLRVGQSHLDWIHVSDSPATYTRTVEAGHESPADFVPPLKARLAARASEFGARGEAAESNGINPYFVAAAKFDDRGQLLEDDQRRYEWDALGRLTYVSSRATPSGFVHASYSDGASPQRTLIVEYRYNLFGERVAKATPGASGAKVTYFVWDGNEIAAEVDQGGAFRDYVYLEGRPVALLSGRAIYAIHTDHRLAPIAVTDANRRVVWEADLSDYGAAKVRAGSSIEMPLRGSNQYFDTETGLHYNVYRYLDAAQGRYISPDPMGLAAGPDLYQFALGQPHVFIDPLGLQSVPADGNISQWSFQTRLQYVLNKAMPQVPGQIADVLRGMTQPKSLAITAGIFAAWAVAQVTPAGWIADLAVAGVGYFFLGEQIGHIVALAINTYQITNGATCVAELDQAASKFAQAVSQSAVALGAVGAAKLAEVLSGAFKAEPVPASGGAAPPLPPSSGVWNLSPFQRGVQIEQALGHNVPPSYPVIDIFDRSTGLGTSIKSLDLGAPTYQTAGGLTSKVEGYIDTLKNFNGINRAGLNTQGIIESRQLDLVVPGQGTAAQQQALVALESYAQSAGVKLNIIIYP